MLSLRIARREAKRNPVRSATVFAMIMLPVMLFVAGATLLRTATFSPLELLPRELGAADASVSRPFDGQAVTQTPDAGSVTPVGPVPSPPMAPQQRIEEVLGPDVRIVAVPSQEVETGIGRLVITEADLQDPMLAPMARLREGRLPAGPDEVAVTSFLADRGAALGSTLGLGGYRPARVVGVVDGNRLLNQVFVAPGFGVAFDRPQPTLSVWLVTRPGGVSWQDVQALNADGFSVLSRQVLENPPADGAADRAATTDETAPLPTLVGLLVTMALLELALLAGPAFAVSAARQVQALGQIAAQGGDRSDLRRIVLAGAVVIATVAAVIGASLGLLATWAGYPLFVALTDGAVGPFDASPLDPLLAITFGVAAAIGAAALPARAAARLDPAMTLIGRRLQPRPLRWPSAFGLLLVLGGGVLTLVGWQAVPADGSGPSALLAAVGSVIAVLGAVMLAPTAVALLGRIAAPAPMPMRYALRDMGRNRMRTAPAVAAVLAAVAGATAVGILVSSNAVQARALYVPIGPVGQVVVNVIDRATGGPAAQPVWRLAQDVALTGVVGGRWQDVPGMAAPPWGAAQSGEFLVVSDSDLLPGAVRQSDAGAAQRYGLSADWYTSPLLVGQAGLVAVADALGEAELASAQAALSAGQAVVLSAWDGPSRGSVELDVVAAAPGALKSYTSLRALQVPAVAVPVRDALPPALAVLPERVAGDSGLAPVTVGSLLLGVQELTPDAVEAMQQRLTASPQLLAAGAEASATLEPGFAYSIEPVLLVVLGAALALVMVAALTASLLSLSEARSDLVTLGEVGASPQIRRRIAATYAAGIVLLGAVLGSVVGVAPGVAGVVLTQRPSGVGSLWAAGTSDQFLTIPWVLVAANILGLPLLLGAMMFAMTPPRLPHRLRVE